LRRQGLKFLAANFRSEHGEIDLIFRDGDCLAFVEVKTRSSEEWARPAARSMQSGGDTFHEQHWITCDC
jgi:putative endonuclease